jgi:hypothetical protein
VRPASKQPREGKARDRLGTEPSARLHLRGKLRASGRFEGLMENGSGLRVRVGFRCHSREQIADKFSSRAAVKATSLHVQLYNRP